MADRDEQVLSNTTRDIQVLGILEVQYYSVYAIICTMSVPQGIERENRLRVDALHRAFPGPFTAAEAAGVLDLPRDRTRRLLAYLTARGWLTRVKQGLYGTVPLGSTDPGAWLADPWVAASIEFEPCYIGGWSAANHWGLTEQLFRGIVVVTAANIRSRNDQIQQSPIRLKFRQEALHFGLKRVWRGENRVNVSDPARTVIDILDEPWMGGGIRHASEILLNYLEREHRDDDLLVSYGDRLGNRTVFKRMGFLVTSLAFDAPDLIASCKERISQGLTSLDPDVNRKGTITKEWNLRVNVEIEERVAT